MCVRDSWNICTLSYTMAFWDWERWERELDLEEHF
jgi:alpha-N-acetylglucosaminidase